MENISGKPVVGNQLKFITEKMVKGLQFFCRWKTGISPKHE